MKISSLAKYLSVKYASSEDDKLMEQIDKEWSDIHKEQIAPKTEIGELLNEKYSPPLGGRMHDQFGRDTSLGRTLSKGRVLQTINGKLSDIHKKYTDYLSAPKHAEIFNLVLKYPALSPHLKELYDALGEFKIRVDLIPTKGTRQAFDFGQDIIDSLNSFNDELKEEVLKNEQDPFKIKILRQFDMVREATSNALWKSLKDILDIHSMGWKIFRWDENYQPTWRHGPGRNPTAPLLPASFEKLKEYENIEKLKTQHTSKLENKLEKAIDNDGNKLFLPEITMAPRDLFRVRNLRKIIDYFNENNDYFTNKGLNSIEDVVSHLKQKRLDNIQSLQELYNDMKTKLTNIRFNKNNPEKHALALLKAQDILNNYNYDWYKKYDELLSYYASFGDPIDGKPGLFNRENERDDLKRAYIAYNKYLKNLNPDNYYTYAAYMYQLTNAKAKTLALDLTREDRE